MKIFISYSQKDRPFAEALAKALKEAGHDIWEPQHLQAGENWRLKSGEALAGADALVVLLSPEAAANEWVRREIEFAISSRSLKGRLIPVMVRPTRDIPWILRELPQWIEADEPTAAARRIVSLLDLGKPANEVEDENRIIAEMASKTGITKKQVKDFIAAITDLAYREAKKGEFAIPGLGKLVMQKRETRVGRNPADGQEIKVPSKKIRVSKSAKDPLVTAKK